MKGYMKYRNIRTTVDNITFASKKESQRYLELNVLAKCGMIQDLRLQVPFEVCPKKNGNHRARYYVADFVYTENGKRIIEDVKSPITRKNPVYSLKKALVLANYPEYIFRET